MPAPGTAGLSVAGGTASRVGIRSTVGIAVPVATVARPLVLWKLPLRMMTLALLGY